MNLILLTIDSLRADHLGCCGYDRNTSPNIDRLAERSVVFQQAIANAPYTKASFKSIMTSTYPFSFEGYHTIRQRSKISELLKQNGYYTVAFPTIPLLSANSGYAMGFDVFKEPAGKLDFSIWLRNVLSKIVGYTERIFKLDKSKVYNRLLDAVYPLHRLYIPYPRADCVTEEVLSTLKGNRNGRFFIWAHYMDLHHPYCPPIEILDQYNSMIAPREVFQLNLKLAQLIRFQNNRNGGMAITKAELEKLVDLYDGEIKCVDDQIGLLLDTLEKANLLNDTLVIITADHGEEFWEHGALGHIGVNNYTHMYDELLRVPLIIRYPRLGKHSIQEQVSLLDLAPTALDMLGLPKAEQFQGRSLLPLINGEEKGRAAVISEASAFNKLKGTEVIPANEPKIISYRTGDWKYIYNEMGPDELYFLKYDPREQQNLVDKEKKLAKALKSRILSHISTQKALERERVKGRIKKLKDLRKI